ncbi:MAG: hypothetical protein PHG25_00385 [Candidatus Pacebacteria bacterium]|nr:hypothetical protein [Candidatus Paceibacterota bacterium]
MQPQSGIKTWQWVVTVVVIIVLIIIGIWVFGGKSASLPSDQNAIATDDTSNTPGALNRVVMGDQYPGNVVYLNSAQFENPGWVVIHADNAGTPGKIIGQMYFVAGISPGKITLTQPMVDGVTYYAMMHSDNGDKKFDATLDLPLKDANGNIIMKVFHASSAAGAQIKG